MEKIYYFDPASPGFYISPDSPLIPEGSVEIRVEQYMQYAGIAWPENKVLGADSSGLPAWLDAPPKTKQEMIDEAKGRRVNLITEAKDAISLWQTELQLGIISDDDKANLIAWMKYIQALNAVDTSTAPDIEWPVKPE